MAPINTLTIEGNLAKNPVLTATRGGMLVAYAELASDATDMFGNKTGTIFLSITGFHAIAQRLGGLSQRPAPPGHRQARRGERLRPEKW